MTESVAERASLRQRFETIEPELSAGAPAWLRALRHEALERFEVLGIPGPGDEEWRNTPLGPIAQTTFERAGAVRGSATLGSSGDWHRIVLWNGRLAANLSSLEALPAGVEVGSLAEVWRTSPERIEPHFSKIATFRERPFAAINTAFFEDGAFVFVPPGTVVDRPIVVFHMTPEFDRPTVVHPRSLIVVGDGSEAVVWESYAGTSEVPYLTNAVTEISIGANAKLEHVRTESEAAIAYHIGVVLARQGRDSRLVSHNVSVGASLARHDVGSVLTAPGGTCLLNGLYLAEGSRVVDNHTFLDHAADHCDSFELYKGIVSGRARAVFNGRIIVRPDAQKTDAKQSNRNLLLSDEATVHTRPQLEIYANDVRCTHGATIGRLDADALFYLRSRGIGEAEARDVLIHAFLKELLDRVPAPSIRASLAKLVEERLPRPGGGERAA
jgi:Fe-S cluster assembly protein SufD